MALDGKLSYAIDASAAGFNGAIQGALSSVGSLSAGLAKLAGASVLGAGVGMGYGVAAAADREQVRVAMEGIIGDIGKAKTVMDSLAKFAASTPFEFGELTDASRKLLSGGGVATEDLITELTALGNVAAAVGTDLGGLATIYVQIADKEKVLAEELMQFGERGAGAIKTALAESLGVSKAALMDMVSQGKVSFDQFRTALQQLAGEGGKWGSMMAKQSAVTKGLFSTLKDNVNELMIAMGEPINDAIKPILSDAIALAQEMQPMMAQIGETVANMITAIRNFIAEATTLEGSMTAVGMALGDALADAFIQALEYAKGFGAVFLAVAGAFGRALSAALDPVLVAVKHGLAAAALNAASVLLKSMANLPGVGKALENQGKVLGYAAGWEEDKAADAVRGDKVWGAFSSSMEQLGNDIAEAASWARDIIRGGKPGDDMQAGQIAPDMGAYEPTQLAPNPFYEAPKETPGNAPTPSTPVTTSQQGGSMNGGGAAEPSTSSGDGRMTLQHLYKNKERERASRQDEELASLASRASLRSADMAAAGGGVASEEDDSGRSRIRGANADKRRNWRQREWARMGKGARAYFSSSMYGGGSGELGGAAEERMNQIDGRGAGQRGGRPKNADTKDAVSNQNQTQTTLLNAMLQELRGVRQKLDQLQSA